jgi:ABC-type iron transport system FetAB ATPase subunit
VVGPSGAGKTTLSRCVSVLERRTSGTAAPPRYLGAAAIASHAARYRSSREYTPKALRLSRKPPPGPRVAVRMALAWSSER